jgi:hypothetical protein
MLQCEKLMSLGLSERKEVVEKSGLCTFCLKHAAELDCYGRGGMSKTRCTRPGCDGEHTPSVHKLMGEENAGVNLVAEDEDETDEDGGEDEDEDEGWWVGTIGAIEVPDQERETLEKMIRAEPVKGDHHSSEEDDFRLEMQPEYSSGDCSADELTEDGWWNPGPTQPYSVEGGAKTQCPTGEWSPGFQRRQFVHDEAAVVPGRSHERRVSHSASAKRRKLRKRPEVTSDQDWEEARRDAWLRQMFSDTSSDEDEERYGRFAESGRWMSELFKIPQHQTATSEGECSG